MVSTKWTKKYEFDKIHNKILIFNDLANVTSDFGHTAKPVLFGMK